jgi:hypothetical protein
VAGWEWPHLRPVICPRPNWFSVEALGFYSGVDRFESRLEHRLSWLRLFLWFYLVLSGMLGYGLGCIMTVSFEILPNSSLIPHIIIWLYSLDIVTWRLKSGIVEPEYTSIAGQRLGKQVSTVTDTQATIEELSRTMFSIRYWNFSGCKTKFSAPLEIFHAAQLFAICTWLSDFRVYIYTRFYNKIMQARSRSHTKSR